MQQLHRKRGEAAADAPNPGAAEPRHRRRGSAAASWRWLLLSLVLALAIVALHLGHLRTQRMRPMQAHQGRAGVLDKSALPTGTRVGPPHIRTLSFDVCGGFALQRIALVSGEAPTTERTGLWRCSPLCFDTP